MPNGVINERETLLAAPPAEGFVSQFGEGAAAPWQGLKYLNRNPSLWRYAILPVVLNIIITALVLAVLVAAVSWFVVYVHPYFTGGQTGWMWWGALALEIMLAVVLLLVCGGIAILTWKLLSGTLCGYFYGRLAEHVERDLGLDGAELKSITLLYELVDTAINLALLVTVNGMLLLLNIVPLVGGAISLVCSTGFTWYLQGLDHLSFPLALRGMRRIDQFRFGRKHIAYTWGLGAVVFVLEFVPILGALFLTTAVVGGVLLHRRIVQAERLEDDSSPDTGEDTVSLNSDMTAKIRIRKSQSPASSSSEDDG